MSHSKTDTAKAVFIKHESNVRSYCRKFPAVFVSAHGSRILDTEGRTYLDFLSGAGTLNYGHNNPAIIQPVMAYLANDGIVHALDMHSVAKSNFIRTFQEAILEPRGMSYKLQFPGPTGTNAVEAALKLARKVTGRHQIVAFSNGFHGMTLGSLAVTSNVAKRASAGVPLGGATFMPYEHFLPGSVNTMDVIEGMLRSGSGIDSPAAILVETVQGEGGLNVASVSWMRRLAQLAKDIGALLIIDDIQAGNGRTGRFFSFEEFGITPDIVVLSKSLSGFGTPLALVLIRPDLDIWAPGEHNGTFRGNNLAFIGAIAAIDAYWRDHQFQNAVIVKAAWVEQRLSRIVASLPPGSARLKGRGLFIGLEFADADTATRISSDLYEDGLIIETCGHRDQVLKLLPPLTISDADLTEALDLIERAALSEQAVPDRAVS